MPKRKKSLTRSEMSPLAKAALRMAKRRSKEEVVKNHTRYEVTFVVEVDDADGSDLVEEAVTSLLGEELRAHEEGGTRCGVRFFDVLDVNASFFERVP